MRSEYPQFARGHFQEIVAKVYFLYQKILKENNALDFDDLILKTVNIFNLIRKSWKSIKININIF